METEHLPLHVSHPDTSVLSAAVYIHKEFIQICESINYNFAVKGVKTGKELAVVPCRQCENSSPTVGVADVANDRVGDPRPFCDDTWWSLVNIS